MKITLVGANGAEDRTYLWPSQVTVEFRFNTFFIGTSETGMAWLAFDDHRFVWQEYTIDGDLTGKEYMSIKIGVEKE